MAAELTERVKKARRCAFVEAVCETPYRHECGGYSLLRADLKPEKRVCEYCGGKMVASGEPSCWPDLLIVADFYGEIGC